MTEANRQQLLVTSGDGPRECRRAVALVLGRIEKEAGRQGLEVDVVLPDGNGHRNDPASALVSLTGAGAERLAKAWTGTIQWTCKSPFRPHHRRQNWFVGVSAARRSEETSANLAPKDLRIETFRAGGPGGQHQNTTDSGVRITHLPTGVSALSTDERSQHRNRQKALERLEARLALKREEDRARDKAEQNRMHRQLERGNPVRTFRGERFAEVR